MMFPINDVATATDQALKDRAYFLYRWELRLEDRGRTLSEQERAERVAIQTEQARRGR